MKARMSRLYTQDLLAVLRGLQMVFNATIKLQEAELKQVWNNSSIKSIAEEVSVKTKNSVFETEGKSPLSNSFQETIERTSMVIEGVQAYVKYAVNVSSSNIKLHTDEYQNETNHYTTSAFNVQDSNGMENILHESVKENVKLSSFKNNIPELNSEEIHNFQELETVKDTIPQKKQNLNIANEYNKSIDQYSSIVSNVEPTDRRFDPTWKKVRPSLSETAKQRKVPSSRVGRLMSFGGLIAGLSVGTVAEFTRRSLGQKNLPGNTIDSAFLTEANAERIVSTLCKVRGAALKIGQILSIQDNTILSPTLQKAFDRVRQSADFMPEWQVQKVLQSELGFNWTNKVTSFENKPFAAASIGQVHMVVLANGQEAAMKIQYPGVAQSITSDIENLVGIMKVWNIFPEGFFIDNLVEVAKRELAWEVDYEREAECTKKFKELLKPYPEFYVPQVIDELSTKQVFTTEFMEGIPVDKCIELDRKSREHICKLIMQLCLRELFEFRYMQTDPNWSNFLYNPESQKLILLDFGASRSYEKNFLDMYIEVIRGAADGDREKVLTLSRDMGFLTGYESKIMEEAHVDTVMILGEVFQSSARPFNFGGQNTTNRVTKLVPTMVKHRLCPPPEEIYSLHRKLSGVFLLCSKLSVEIECRSFFEEMYYNYTHSQL